MSKTFLETIVILSLRWRGVAGKKLCKQLVGPWCHEKCPSPPFTARPAAGTILATLHSGLTHFGTLYIFTRAAHRGLSVYWSRALLVCNAQFYTIPIVQAIEQECIAHRQCAVTQNNERFCRGGLSSAVTITGGSAELAKYISMEFLSPAVTTITNTLYCHNVFPCLDLSR